MKKLTLALALIASSAVAAETVPVERADVVVNFTNMQRAIAEMLAKNEQLSADKAALEARLQTALDWLKQAKGE